MKRPARRTGREIGRPRLNLALKLAIIARGRPAYVIAYEVGLSPTTLSSIVTGQRAVTAAEARRIARAVRGDLSALFPELPAE